MKTQTLNNFDALYYFMNLKNSKIWDYLAWLALAYIFVWLILKMLGVIHTPVLIEYSPLLCAVYIAGNAIQKLKRSVEDIAELKKETKCIKEKVIKIETNCRIKCTS